LLYLASLYNYLLFHALAEIFSVVVALTIFIFAWNTRLLLDNDYLLFLGIAYFFVGGLDLLHTLSYTGMAVIHDHSANVPTQLWIASRGMEATSLLLAPFFLQRKSGLWGKFLTYLAVTVLLALSIFYWKVFPDCYLEPTGLTPFKRISEYIISIILVAAAVVTYQNRDKMDVVVFRLVIASIMIAIAREFFFTLYSSVFGFSNLVGHILKIVSYFLIYKAIVDTGFKKPYSLLFRNLKQSQEVLTRQKEELEDAMSRVKVLGGLLPICANCKKIRDDRGYWSQLESYIQKHSDANFSHGLCPECAKNLYPGLYDQGQAKNDPPEPKDTK
jgi:hypothetical protein